MPIPRLVRFRARALPAGTRIKARALYTGYVAEHDLAQAARRATRRQGRGRRLGGRRRGRRAAAQAALAARPQDGAGRPDVAPAGRREHAGGGARGARARPATRRHRRRTGARRLHDAAGATRRCRSPRPATTPSSRPCAAPTAPCWCRSARRARPSRPIAPGSWPSAAWWPWCRRARCRPQSLADAVGRALAGPSLRSFPPCDVNGGPATAALASPDSAC